MAEQELISEFEVRRVERMLAALYSGKLRRGEAVHVVGGGVEAGWVSVRWELADADRSRVYPVEARVKLTPALRERKAVDLLYDLLAVQFTEHLVQREPFTGPGWEEVDFEGVPVFLRGQMQGESAESAASQLLESDAFDRSRALRAAGAHIRDTPPPDPDPDPDPDSAAPESDEAERNTPAGT